MTKTHTESNPVGDDILNAFLTMWSAYPSPVMLLKANRDIVTVNDSAAQLGIPVGIYCFALTGHTGVYEHF